MRALLLLVGACVLSAVEVGPLTVAKIVDGDTIWVCDGDPTVVGAKCDTVRLQFIDTPECSDNSHGKVMEEGKKAKEFLANLLPVGSLVYLHTDKSALETDRYGQLLAILKAHAGPDGKPRKQLPPPNQITTSKIIEVNAEIIRAGWSPYWMRFGLAPDRYDASFRLAQDQADKAGVGLWETNLEWIQGKANERAAPKE